MGESRRKAALNDLSSYNSVSGSRLQSLYSDLSRQRVSNPAAFQSNVNWWKNALSELAARGLQQSSQDILILRADPTLSEQLRYDGVGKPLGLAAVITELKSKNDFIPMSEFLNSNASIYDSGSLAFRIASFVVGKPLWWALEQLNVVDLDNGIGWETESSLWRKFRGDYVVLTNLEKAADSVLQSQSKKTGISLADSLYSFDSFRRTFGEKVFSGVSLSENDVKVLVKYLERDRKAVLTDKDTIKFIDSLSDISHESVTAVDTGILELKLGVENMEAQINDLQSTISARSNKVSEYLKENRKDLALSHLKSKKQLEELLKKRLTALETLQSTLLQVEDAYQNIQIMKQYESSTATLRAILSHPSLQREKIDETLEAMAAASAEQRDIDETIRLGLAVSHEDTIDEIELEAELAGLVAEATREKREQEDIAAKAQKQGEGELAAQSVQSLPSVPSEEIGNSASKRPQSIPLSATS